MFNAIVTHFSKQVIAFQLIFLAKPGLPRTSTEPRRVIGSFSGKFILELCLTQGSSITRPGVEPTTSNHSQFQPPSSRFTSLRYQARQREDIQDETHKSGQLSAILSVWTYLTAKLIAWESQNPQPVLCIFFIQLDKLSIIHVGFFSFRCHIHNDSALSTKIITQVIRKQISSWIWRKKSRKKFPYTLLQILH